ncbi:MAG: DEAD/DEAH box helicase [Lachnospiraceae bacterium]|nr:DEAD/DEAH box helicase [Lachnospiraceae bacterium]
MANLRLDPPNFDFLNQYRTTFPSLDEELIRILNDESHQVETLQQAVFEVKKKDAVNALKEIPVSELAQSKSGIRVAALEKAGITNLGQLATRSTRGLESISGIGEAQAKAIRQTLNLFEQRMAETINVRLSVDEPTPEGNVLILALYKYLKADPVWDEIEHFCARYHNTLTGAVERLRVHNRLRWLFSTREEKESTLDGFDYLTMMANEGYEPKARDLIRQYQTIRATSFEKAKEHFVKENAAYYALLEKLGHQQVDRSILYKDMPSEMADAVDRSELDTSLLKVTLRSYQEFGAKYILKQGQVLLGDEMGLGKTIMAIAAMASIAAKRPDAHFMVVCPASVLINWCREIEKHSALKAFLLHGDHRREEMEQFLNRGGVAVTNYESLDEFIEELERPLTLAMLVVDEAHYVKNPEAKRTKYLYETRQFAERTLLMTGTPLENRVEEMCSIIAIIRQDMIEDIHEYAFMKNSDQFKKILAPVYLRRTREDVLKELPEMVDEPQWVNPTPEDKEPYITEVVGGNFMGMRRIGWLQDDMSRSSKATRLMELCEEAFAEGRKVLIFSYYKDTLQKVKTLLKDKCVGPITGATTISQRQDIIDFFSAQEEPLALASQVLAGGTGLNIQAASVVIFCEPQIKPSLETQAVSRVYRMGQVRSVLVYHLLCNDTVDEDMMLLLEEKQEIFDTFAQESEMADIEKALGNNEWIQAVIAREREKNATSPVH